ncbi:MAG: adenylyl-sulfate kinase [Bacteroidia bacterium]
MNQHIHPNFEQWIARDAREQLIGQRGCVIWLTGLSGSGKSTLAAGLQQELHAQHKLAYILDGDNLRAGINANLGFSEEDRFENIRRVAEIAKLFVDAGLVVICSFVSPTNSLRQLARQVIGENDFYEIYVQASLEVCEKRDVKGLYAKARRGELKNFTGIDAPFDVPRNPVLVIDTAGQTPAASINELLAFMKTKIERP